MSIDWTLAGTVIITGIVVVFLILVLLIGFVTLVGKIMVSMTGKKQSPRPSAPAAPAPAAPAKAPVAAPVAPSTDGDETIAVISAAVSAYMEQTSPGVPYAVTGIAPAAGREKNVRPVWGFAGMRQNTEPF